ncbi:hypothetical protein OBBRIDRAFT_837323 [Obba rivulosa]|uniref:Clp1-like protein n=1 Tax=Obba rivulosa TaxID=1052685 RepID=A0A8E2DJ43_9APHY|nr:hypothetical protein OBBRIDRAFT_837323 [Obba rivulosa]
MARHTTKRPFLRKSSNAENFPLVPNPRAKHTPTRIASVTFFPDDTIRASSRARRLRALKPRQRSFAKPTLHPAEPAHAEVRKPAESRSTDTKASTPELRLPRRLARPAFREVSHEAMAAVDPELKEMPLSFIREGLEIRGPDMLKVLASVHATPARHVLPKELRVRVRDRSYHPPTHMLAVYSPAPAPRRAVTLFPVHDVVLAAHCASLPPLGPAAESPEPEAADHAQAQAEADAGIETEAPLNLTLPVVPLALPHPPTFSALSAFLYTKRAETLLVALLPSLPPSPSSMPGAQPRARPAPAQLARAFAATYTTRALAAHALRVTGAWRNACALGVHDDALWRVLDAAWEIVLASLSLSTGRSIADITAPVQA